MDSNARDSLRIFTPIGNVGYDYDTSIFWDTIEKRSVDAVICDAGLTDCGPQKLALGYTTAPRQSYEADLEPMVAAAHAYHVPVIISSAGGDGSNDSVDLYVDSIDNIVSTRGYRSLKILKIYAEISKNDVTAALHSDPSRVSPCGGGVPPLTDESISSASRIVAQMGIQPFLDAMRSCPDFDIIIAGRSYDPASYAAFCVYHNILDLGVAYHMGNIMECGALCATPKSREALATVRKDSFDVTPLDPGARCTKLSVAAHTLYEKSRPDLHYGPDGMLDLTHATHTELPDGRSVRVSGSKFHTSTEDSKWTIKLEGARANGYHSVFMGGFADPILISQIDNMVPRVKAYVASKCGTFNYDLKLTAYGFDGALDILGGSQGKLSPSKQKHQPSTVGILGQARASTQQDANMVVATARKACIHGPYRGQKATSGNFAMPTAPMDIEMGPITKFNVYLLMTADDPAEVFPIELHIAEGSGKSQLIDKTLGPGTFPMTKSLSRAAQEANPSIDPTKPFETSTKPFEFAPNQLGSLASVIRSKNSGPFEVMLDVMFDSPATYERVKSSGILNRSKILELYDLDESKIQVAMWWDQALAFKATIVRPMSSGSWGEIDKHSSTQHVPLMFLEVPQSPAQMAVAQMANFWNRIRGVASFPVNEPTKNTFAVLAVISYIALFHQNRVLAAIQNWRN